MESSSLSNNEAVFIYMKQIEKSILSKIIVNYQPIVKFDKQDKLCRTYSISAFSHPPRDNLSRVSNYIQSLHEINRDELDPTNGLKVDDIEKIGELNNLKLDVFEISEENALSNLYASKNMKKVINEEIHEDIFHGIHEDNHEDNTKKHAEVLIYKYSY